MAALVAAKERHMAQMVADVLVGVLEQIGVRQIFGLIGDSLNPLGDAVRRSKIEWIGVRHEEGAALAAAGQAKLTGRLGVCAGTTGPGSTHLVAGLYEAARDHAPVLALSGNMVSKMRGLDYFQATEPDLLFRDVSPYTETITSAAQAPALIHQAISAGALSRSESARSSCAASWHPLPHMMTTLDAASIRRATAVISAALAANSKWKFKLQFPVLLKMRYGDRQQRDVLLFRMIGKCRTNEILSDFGKGGSR